MVSMKTKTPESEDLTPPKNKNADEQWRRTPLSPPPFPFFAS